MKSSLTSPVFLSYPDALEFTLKSLQTVCGDDVCLIICEDNSSAIECFDKLKEFAPPFFLVNTKRVEIFNSFLFLFSSQTKDRFRIDIHCPVKVI